MNYRQEYEKWLASPALSEKMQQFAARGASQLTFLIG